MVKLTAELIEQAAQYTNAVRDRELDLRGESGDRAGRPRASPLARAACAEGWSSARACLHDEPQAGRAAPGPPRPGSCRCYQVTIS